ncbi:drug resistance transporter, EmrB/QacA subfamily [Actinacidiphila yanglinensis]|uniref:Drug resistance transporter, EmrB/QacA subfamily n=1 Tax=Actinacidiphila yanglinensis TaxID=310779 RepID=A0A1H6A4C1_9ACTN|nr:MFS transporter [Actinacidiphila yanglinensis]SEG42925.1 drug resistance transporter, EmrB/QacA subfamily [Actinacidiphila yanglinensis]
MIDAPQPGSEGRPPRWPAAVPAPAAATAPVSVHGPADEHLGGAPPPVPAPGDLGPRHGISSRQRAVAFLMAGCLFMENLDGTIVSTAAPRIGASLGVSATAIGLVVTAYVLTLAVLVPLSGWLTARFGARRIFLSAIVLFTLASLACAGATSLGELVALRVLQGAGGAMMVPVGRLLALSGIAKPDIPRLVAYIVWPALIAPVAAPLLGGVITTYASWHWLFLINIPLGLVAFAVAWRLVEGGPVAGVGALDWRGLAWTSLGLGALASTGHLLSQPGASWPRAGALGAVSLVLLALALRHLRRTDHPLIDLGSLRTPSFRATVYGGSVFWISVSAVPFLLPLLFQEVFGWSAVRSGSLVLFVFVGNIGIKPATGFLFGRFGYRAVLAGAGAVLAGTMVGCAFLTAATPLWVIGILVTISGAARSTGLTGYNTLAFADVPPDRMRDANTLNSTATQTAAGLGVAAAPVALRLGHPLTQHLLGHASPALSYAAAFTLLSLPALAATTAASRLPPGTGDILRSRR